ncbi:hypothetical protein GL263_26545, partial [Streptomyces durbertensis]
MTTHPVADLCRRAAAACDGARLLETPGLSVLLAPREGAVNLTVAYGDHEAALWLDTHKWSEYDWTPDDHTELDDLAATISAVQRGDAELHYRRSGPHLTYTGARVATQHVTTHPAAPDA